MSAPSLRMSQDDEQPMADSLGRKRKVRGGHRSTVTRLLNKLPSVLESENVSRLKQIMGSLREKMDLLAKFDDEIVEIVSCDDLEKEIEQADLIREDISLAIISIEEALSVKLSSSRPSHSIRHHGGASPSISPESSVEGDNSTHNLTETSEDLVVTGTTTDLFHTTGTSILTFTSGTSISSSLTTTLTPSSSFLPGSLHGTGASHPNVLPSEHSISSILAGGLNTTTSHSTLTAGALPYACGGLSSAYSSAPMSIAPLTLGIPLCHPAVTTTTSVHTLPPFSLHDTPTFNANPHVRLPKLTIKKFNGDLTKWVTFWDTFNSSIHTNPTLSNVDKFSYLTSLLESTAAESIAGLSLTSSNYDEAIATLKRRFGNFQLIINQHMEALLNIASMTSHHDTRGLRKLYDKVESHVRGLRSLGVSAESYGGLLTSVLVNKLPLEIRLILSRVLTGERWELDRVMKLFEEEVNARERAVMPNSPAVQRRVQSKQSTAAALVAGSSVSLNTGVTCSYCGQGHPSVSCNSVTDVPARKEILRKSGRCYVCLRKNHLSRECRSNLTCKKCRGRHHVSICSRRSNQGSQSSSPEDTSTQSPPTEVSTNQESSQGSTSTLYAGSRNSVLLQTARVQLFNLNTNGYDTTTRAILDTGSQRTYVTCRLRDELNLPTIRTESLRIKTFGSTESYEASCNVVQLGLMTRHDGVIEMTALVVPCICNPLTAQPIGYSQERYDHLMGLDLSDSANASESLDIDMLIGSDLYWQLVTGSIIRGEHGPTAIQTKVGWVLSGPTEPQDVSVNLTLTSTHALKIDDRPVEPTLDDQLKQFWELESLGIMKDEVSVYDKFVQKIRFDGQRYEVNLPWKEHHPPLHDHRELCSKRLLSLLRRLKQTPQLLTEYDGIIREQLERGIIEVVAEPAHSTSDRIHYLPHHCVIRQDRATSKLRVVYDASARSSGPSLNDCLYTGPKFTRSIFDIILRFRAQPVALIGDIEKAFLMISVQEQDRDSLRFLWATNPNVEVPELITFRFTRVMFGVSSSPFLLNATINHHLESYRDIDPAFVDKFLSSIYVDDLVSGSGDEEAAYELYMKSKLRLAEAGFKLRKFATNCVSLHHRIQESEGEVSEGGAGESKMRKVKKEPTLEMQEPVREEDQSYAKTSLGASSEEQSGVHKVLGVRWNIREDTFEFDISELASMMEDLDPTKRSIVSITAKFFDPLGVLSPVTILFKMFCQQLCEAKVGWDELLTGTLLERWDCLLLMLKNAITMSIPRCVFSETAHSTPTARLVGFCDASTKAYSAVIYLTLEADMGAEVRFLASKTRVAPVVGTTIPRMELLSALLLSKLISSVAIALKSEMLFEDPICFTDSKVALYWIQGTQYEWRQFVQNRVTTIRELVKPQCWRHCPGSENPADIPSRGMSASVLAESQQWLNGPQWLNFECTSHLSCDEKGEPIPDQCRNEMKIKDAVHVLVSVGNDVTEIFNPEICSSTYRLFKITALVKKFIHYLRSRVHNCALPSIRDVQSSVLDLDGARLYWIKCAQSQLLTDKKFPLWEQQLGLYQDKSGVWRCKGRMSNSCLRPSAQNPILLDKKHHLAKLVVMDAHLRVLHDGVSETLAELRSAYWLVRGRQFVRKLLYNCVVCRKFEGRPYRSQPPPPLPDFRVRQSRPFQTTGVDFAGPFFVKPTDGQGTTKVWLCLYTCCSTRAVHLDLVPDMTAATFLRSFKRFTARRGIPMRMISDNAKTFKAASAGLIEILKNSEAVKYFSQLHIEWKFNLERAPWWGGIFERMVKSAKRCLKKAIGRNSLTHDELLTLVVEVEAVLNSRPLSYVSSEDVTEPLTPSHLLTGYRVLSLPDPDTPNDDPDFSSDSAACLTRRMHHLTKSLQQFWRRWKREYLLELREHHRTQLSRGETRIPEVGEVVTVYDEGHPRGLWRLGRVECLIEGVDGVVRGVKVKVVSKKSHAKVLRRPVQHIYPLEVCQPRETGTHNLETKNSDECETPTTASSSARPKRKAALNAREIVRVISKNS